MRRVSMGASIGSSACRSPKVTHPHALRGATVWPVVEVSIAVLTYHRNDDLRALLPLLLGQIVDATNTLETAVVGEVLVVDNDPEGGASDVVGPFAEKPVRYFVEKRPGIAAARNRALDEAPVDGVVVFIDDDERPTAGWLTLLLSTWLEHRSAAVGGPVEATFTGAIDPWIEAGGFFDRSFRSAFRTGEAVRLAPTGNILLDMSKINSHQLRFDSTLGLAGGEDTLFTRQLVDLGEQIIWCGEAVVLDPVPSARLTRRWVIARTFFVSNASIHASIKLAQSRADALRTRLRYGATGSARLILGSAQALAGFVSRGRRNQAKGVGRAARGAGCLTAVLGLRFEEYRR